MLSTTGRPSYDPAVMLKTYIHGYLNRIYRERECQRNVELMNRPRGDSLIRQRNRQIMQAQIAA
jgi:transposase